MPADPCRDRMQDPARRRRGKSTQISRLCAVILAACFCASQLRAQSVSVENRITLSGSVHPLARAEFDRGAAPDTLPMERMLLVLKQTSAQQADLRTFLTQVQDKSSPNYHKWLTPDQFGTRFGSGQADVAKITTWLTAKGFTIGKVNGGRTSIEFSGTAGQVRNAFTTEIHKYVVNGQEHWANASDVQIPASFAPLVAGVATLHNFLSKPQHRIVTGASVTARKSTQVGITPLATNGSSHALSPADVNLIYNDYLPPASVATIGIVARSNIDVQDVLDFSTALGLQTLKPNLILNGPDPGDLGGDEEEEAVLDVTWSGAIALNTPVNMVISASTNSTDGIYLSELYIVDNNIATIMSESFGACEAEFTPAEEAFVSLLAEQAAAQGITYLVAAGDSGSAGCDDPTISPATGPISVNGLASTPFNTAVGGTQFNENGNPSAYWNSTSASNGESALSYIPEDVWNESGGSSLYAGGGGSSVYFAKPVWQEGVAGIPADGARDLPDVSFSAALHDPYLLCIRGSCNAAKNNGKIEFAEVGGTSVSTPVFAGLLANVFGYILLGTPQGNIAPILYALAASENLASCNGSNVGGLPAGTCIFNDVTLGNNAVPGESGTVKYPATVGYDLASGLGSVNVTNLARAWLSAGGVSGFNTDYSPQYVGAVGVQASIQTQLTLRFPEQTTPLFALSAGNEFSLQGESCSPQGSAEIICIVTVQFAPRYAGMRQDGLIVTASSGYSYTVPLFGIGQAAQVVLVPGQMTAFAGSGALGYSGDGGSASAATLKQPRGISLDPSGNMFIADTQNNVIRKVDAHTGVISTFAGTGAAGFSGDAGPATQAQLNQPQATVADGAGNVYIADTGNSLVRRVDAVTGRITTVLGNGSYGFAQNFVDSLNTSFGSPSALALDTNGNLYVCDSAFPSVWQLNLFSRLLQIFAGNGTQGYSGDGGFPTSATLNSPSGVAVDASGAVYVADTGNNVIRKVVTPFISTIVGTGTAGYSGDFGQANESRLNSPRGLAADAAGNIYISDTNNGVVRLVASSSNLITTIAGDRTFADTGNGGSATAAGLDFPISLALDGKGDLFVTTNGNVVRDIQSNTGLLSFRATAPQTALVVNAGNQPLVLDAVALSSDFTLVTPPETQCAPGTVGSGAFFTIAVEETPASCVTPTGAINLTDNNLGGTGSLQQILLNPPAGAIDTWLVDIDVPSSPDDPIQGPVMFSGWAFNGKSPVTALNISIDGAAAGQAFYGAYRPDVCAVFGSQPGCPNIGWSLVYNTQFLTNGSHLLQVTATAADGSHSVAGRNFNVANWSTANPTHIDFDSPSSGATYSGTTSFGGWIIDNDAPVTSVAISIDDSPAGNATYGIYRADVCAVFSGSPGCPNVGWAYTLDTTRLADGRHTVELTATVNGDRKSTASATFTVANGAANNPVTPPMHINIDTSLTGALSGSVNLTGWAVDDLTAVTNITVSVDGAALGNAIYGIYRADVCSVFPGRAGCPNVGWIYSLDTTQLANGAHTLSITASGVSSRATVESAFTVANGSGPFHLNIDDPSALTGPVTGLASFIGWAFNDNGPIDTVTYSIDGVPYGLANYGEYRADVCAVYPGKAGCPNIGWFLSVDTTQLTGGPHTFAITASSGTDSSTASATFTVANWTASNPFQISIDAPASNATVSGVTTLFGWAFDTSEDVKQVIYAVDGVPLGTAAYGIYRPDACAAFGNPPGCPLIGWSGTLNTALLTNGLHNLNVTVTSVGGLSYTEQTQFAVRN